MTDGVLHHNQTSLAVSAAAITVTAMMGFTGLWFGNQFRIRLIEAVGFELNREIARLVSIVPGLEPYECADFQDQLELLRQGHGLLGGSLNTMLSALRVIVFGVGTIATLAFVSPVLLIIVPFAFPALAITATQQRWSKVAESLSAEPSRQARYLQELTVDRNAGLELRVLRLRNEIIGRLERTWRKASDIVSVAHQRSALLGLAGELFFLIGFAGVMGLMLWRASHGLASTGDVVLAVYLMQEVRAAVVDPIQSASNVGETLRVAGRILWLKDYAKRAIASISGSRPAPVHLTEGIVFDRVSFRYPGTVQWVLRDISFRIPAGATIALIGENGAGKTTLVKLLCRMYEPTEGRVLIDGVDLREIDIGTWRDRLSAAFQDFVRFEFIAQHAIGFGDLSKLGDRGAVHAAMARAGAADLLVALPAGPETQLGVQWEGGMDLSTGQWQKLALGRALMREDPLLIFFDEPTASLDALAEHTLFERYADRARVGSTRGTVTMLVSHRFSNVRSADLIVVMDGGVVVEAGSHDELLRRQGGLYAQLYHLQAEQYV